jgi:hypothetical protein
MKDSAVLMDLKYKQKRFFEVGRDLALSVSTLA